MRVLIDIMYIAAMLVDKKHKKLADDKHFQTTSRLIKPLDMRKLLKMTG